MNYNLEKAAEKLSLGTDSLKKHINGFYREFRNNSERIRTVIDSGDPEKIYFEFHKLKSTFKMISADEAQEVCQICCDCSREKKLFPYSESFDRIVNLFDQLYDTINGIGV